MKKELSDYLATLGKKGGKKVLKKYGIEHYKKMAEKRWKKNKTEEQNDNKIDN